MSLKIDKEKMNKLYALEKYGVPRTHLECLMWFDVNKGKGVDADTLKGKRVPGRMPDKTVKGITKKGFPYQACYPIPDDNIVLKPHYLHAGVRGSYKPAGEEIVGYDDKKRKAIWKGDDTFVQAIQTGNGNLEGYGPEITFDEDGNWVKSGAKIDYDHDAITHAKNPYTEITNGELQRCYDNKIPIGVIYKKSKGVNEILGLGMITKISENKLNYTINPYDWNSNADLDTLVDAWIQKLAKSTEYNPDSKPLEEWCDDFARGEIQNRYDTLPNIGSAVVSFEMGESTPADLLKAFSKNDVLRDNYLYQKLGKPGLFTENPEAKKIIDQIIQHHPAWQKPENATGNVMNAMKNLTDVKLSGGQVFQPHFAKVLISTVLSSMRPDLFVDYRKNRWNELAKQIGTSFMEDGEEEDVIAAAELAQSITLTNSFKKYFGGKYKDASGNEHLLWVLAGITWVIRGGLDNVDENLSDVADKILLGDPENGKPEIAIEKDVVLRILRHLESGKHVILVGAPGVGKTMLSKRILEIYGMKKTSKEYVKSVATAEWSRYHVIGGLNLEGEWNRGKVSEAAEEGKWLLIDEFNRADINKAFGELFLGIEDGEITLSEVERKAREEKLNKEKREPETKIIIPKTFRMIGTMNDYDKNLLLTELSYGLITRFAFVDIKPDEEKEEESVKRQIIENDEAITEKDWDSCSKEIKDFFEFNKKVREWRMIGVRTTIDVIRYMISASKDTNKKKLDYLDEALCDYLLPQFDRLDAKTIEETEKASKKMNAKGFTEGLTKMRKDLEAKSNIWNEQ